MRANKPAKFCEDIMPMIYKSGTADYINQLRVDRLMAKVSAIRNLDCDFYELHSFKNFNDFKIQKKRIAEALEARAKKIKDAM